MHFTEFPFSHLIQRWWKFAERKKTRRKSVPKSGKYGGPRIHFPPFVPPSTFFRSSADTLGKCSQVERSEWLITITSPNLEHQKCARRGTDCSRKLNSGPGPFSFFTRKNSSSGTSTFFFMREWRTILMRWVSRCIILEIRRQKHWAEIVSNAKENVE